MLTGEQLRAARAMLRWEQAQLAEKAGVSTDTIKRLEKVDGPLKAQDETLTAIRRTLELAGLDLGHDGVRRAVNRDAIIMRDIAAEITSLVIANLEQEARLDSEFFERGPKHVAKQLARFFEPIMVEVMVERVMKPTKRRRKGNAL